MCINVHILGTQNIYRAEHPRGYGTVPLSMPVVCFCLARVTNEPAFKAKAAWSDHLCQVIVAYDLRLDSRVGTEGSMVSSLNCDGWLILRSEALSH